MTLLLQDISKMAFSGTESRYTNQFGVLTAPSDMTGQSFASMASDSSSPTSIGTGMNNSNFIATERNSSLGTGVSGSTCQTHESLSPAGQGNSAYNLLEYNTERIFTPATTNDPSDVPSMTSEWKHHRLNGLPKWSRSHEASTALERKDVIGFQDVAAVQRHFVIGYDYDIGEVQFVIVFKYRLKNKAVLKVGKDFVHDVAIVAHIVPRGTTKCIKAALIGAYHKALDDAPGHATEIVHDECSARAAWIKRENNVIIARAEATRTDERRRAGEKREYAAAGRGMLDYMFG